MKPKKHSLVLIPGLLSNDRVWAHQVSHLQDVANIYPIQFSHEKTIEQMIVTILKNAPPYFALAGHSMGGVLVFELLKRAPNRIVKACLLNTTARADTPKKVAFRQKMIEMAKQGQFLTVAQHITDFFVHQPDTKKKVMDMFMEVGAQTFICEEQAMMQLKSNLEFLPKITCPTMVIHGRKDANFTLDFHEEIATLIPNAQLVIVEDTGHMSPMEMPQAITALMRYWLLYCE